MTTTPNPPGRGSTTVPGTDESTSTLGGGTLSPNHDIETASRVVTADPDSPSLTGAAIAASPSTRRRRAKKDRPFAASERQADRERKAERLRVAIGLVKELHGITLADLARRADLVSANALHNFLSGRSRGLTWHTVTRLREAFPELDALGAHSEPTSPTSLAPRDEPTRRLADQSASVSRDQMLPVLRRLVHQLRSFNAHLDATCAELEGILDRLSTLGSRA